MIMFVMGEYYGIRHKVTGRLMPATIGRQARGWSFWDPITSACMQLPQEPPRLFASKRSAINAASGWAQEIHVVTTQWEQDGWESPGYQVSHVEVLDPERPRKYSDLEVVRLLTTVIEEEK